ncbi:hypothetical protein [Paenibacillus hamazuiensis]|nr:hypothetical protein [Paenibacillus hamazuiensis]
MTQSSINSKAQEQQEQKNKQLKGMDTNNDGNFDKKLDGPSRPQD